MHRILTKSNKKGFTLIELLVVIAIIAILFVVVLLTLNPAELLRQARDSNRVSDLGTIKSAISLFEADVATSSVSALGTWTKAYTNDGFGGPIATLVGTGSAANWGFTAAAAATVQSSTSRAVNGGGWLPVNFNAISSGAPIGSEPVDPLNNSTNFYAYVASSTVFKLATKTESVKFNTGGSGDVESTDGGNSTSTYEQGTNLTL